MNKGLLEFSSLLLLGCGLIFSSQQVNSFTILAPSKEKDSYSLRPFTVLSAGVDFIHTGSSDTVMLLPPFSNYYSGNSSYPASGSLGIGAGIEKQFLEAYFWQLGMSGFFNSAVTNSGIVWQFGLPEFNNLQYRYQVQSSRIVVAGKLLGTVRQSYHPYLSAELGSAFNSTSNYMEIPLIPEAVPMAPFAQHTQSSFSWGLGAGVDVAMNAHLRLGMGYQFVNLGRATLGLSPAQATQERLSNSNRYDHQLRFQLTALI